MSSPKPTKNKSRTNARFSSSRLIKTNGKFSKGKLAMIAFSFVAIGALIINLTHAWSYQNVVSWQDEQAHPNWYDSRVVNCSAQWQGCTLFTADYPNNYEPFWYGPYTTLGIPTISGSDGEMCANVHEWTGSQLTVDFNFDITANSGNIILWSMGQNYVHVLPDNSFHLVCEPFHIGQPPKGVWPGFWNVEYRVKYMGKSYVGTPGQLLPVLTIGQVGIFIK